jgi:hypothetical protein
VEETEQLVIEAGFERQRTHDAGRAQMLGVHRQARYDGGEPQEGVHTREGRTQ